jgi:hypothetical protein
MEQTLNDKKTAIIALNNLIIELNKFLPLLKKANGDTIGKLDSDFNNNVIAGQSQNIISKVCTQQQKDAIIGLGSSKIKGIKSTEFGGTGNALIQSYTTAFSNYKDNLIIVKDMLEKEVSKQPIVESNLKSTQNRKNYIGTTIEPSGWKHGTGHENRLPNESSNWFAAIGTGTRERLTPREKIVNGEYHNANGAITWNTKDGAFEDTTGAKFIPNDDGRTFDDGKGNNFNADGTPAKSGSGFFGRLEDFGFDVIFPSAIEVAKNKINADTSLNETQKQTQIQSLLSINPNATKTNWVIPITIVGGIVAAALSYHYFIAKKK